MASSRRRRSGPVGEGANLTGSFHPSPWVGNPARFGLDALRVAVRDALGRALDRHQPAREPRQAPAGGLDNPEAAHRGDIRPGSGPTVPDSASRHADCGLDQPSCPGRRAISRPTWPAQAALSPAQRLSDAHPQPGSAPISPATPSAPEPRPDRPQHHASAHHHHPMSPCPPTT